MLSDGPFMSALHALLTWGSVKMTHPKVKLELTTAQSMEALSTCGQITFKERSVLVIGTAMSASYGSHSCKRQH